MQPFHTVHSSLSPHCFLILCSKWEQTVLRNHYYLQKYFSSSPSTNQQKNKFMFIHGFGQDELDGFVLRQLVKDIWSKTLLVTTLLQELTLQLLSHLSLGVKGCCKEQNCIGRCAKVQGADQLLLFNSSDTFIAVSKSFNLCDFEFISSNFLFLLRLVFRDTVSLSKWRIFWSQF